MQKKRKPVLDNIPDGKMARDSALSATLPESGGQERSWHKPQADANTTRRRKRQPLYRPKQPQSNDEQTEGKHLHTPITAIHQSINQPTNHEAVPAPPLRLPTNLQRSISNPSKQPQPATPPPQQQPPPPLQPAHPRPPPETLLRLQQHPHPTPLLHSTPPKQQQQQQPRTRIQPDPKSQLPTTTTTLIPLAAPPEAVPRVRLVGLWRLYAFHGPRLPLLLRRGAVPGHGPHRPLRACGRRVGQKRGPGIGPGGVAEARTHGGGWATRRSRTR